MVELINKVTGTKMYVADDRADEYLAAGHKPAAKPVKAKATTKSKPQTKKTVKK